MRENEVMSIRVAIIGGGPAGIYAAHMLTKSDADVSVDILERLPAPFGLVRYGVAPDHPRIKEIIKALDRVLAKDEIRFLGNVNYGVDVKLDDLREFYDAIVFSTGAKADTTSESGATTSFPSHAVRIDRESLPTGIEMPSAGQSSSATAFTVS